MTGFARSGGERGAYAWTWELKSVNGRGLDLRCRMPSGHDALEPQVRSAAGKRFQRGNITINLQLQQTAGEGTVRINDAVLTQLVEVMQDLETRIVASPPRLDGLLALRGVMEIAEPEESESEREARERDMLANLNDALDALAAARQAEGERLAAILTAQLAEIETLVGAAAEAAEAQPAALKARLHEQVKALLDEEPALPEERLTQEVALLTMKADVREEIDRLGSHLAAARELLAAGNEVGRRLDFLAQEFNREANTLCAKSAGAELTAIGLDLKAVIDRLREQTQNIE